jgi:hypothetical protein
MCQVYVLAIMFQPNVLLLKGPARRRVSLLTTTELLITKLARMTTCQFQTSATYIQLVWRHIRAWHCVPDHLGRLLGLQIVDHSFIFCRHEPYVLVGMCTCKANTSRHEAPKLCVLRTYVGKDLWACVIKMYAGG